MSDPRVEMSDERRFIEDLLAKRFNFFLILYSLTIGGVLQAKSKFVLILVMSLGLTLSALLMWTLWRLQTKLNCIFRELGKLDDPQHPWKIIDDQCDPWLGGQRLIGYVIPTLCVLSLGIGLCFAIGGVFEPPGIRSN